jgi:acetate kinase
MKILVLNCGSSSIKYQLFNMEDEAAMASGLAERVGEPQGRLTHYMFPDTEEQSTIVREEPILEHKDGYTHDHRSPHRRGTRNRE